MALYKGFSTQRSSAQLGQPYTPPTNKFGLTDVELVKRDFLNSLLIPQGQVVGDPSKGTTLWSFTFEQNDAITNEQIVAEVKRMAAQDERLIVNSVVSVFEEKTITLTIEYAVSPFNQPAFMRVALNPATMTLSEY